MDDQLAQELQSNEHRFEDLPAEKQERLRAIVDLRRRNVTNATIAKLLKVGEATIYRDSQLLRQLNVSRATQLDLKCPVPPFRTAMTRINPTKADRFKGV